jgi:hypothetical protein
MNTDLKQGDAESATGYALFPLLPSVKGYETMHTKDAAFPTNIREFIDAEKWTFAKTMPDWPHEYLVRDRVDKDLFVAMVQHIRAHGYEGRFYKRKITYFDEDGMTYWTMGSPIEETTIINRCVKENTFEAREKAGTLPD